MGTKRAIKDSTHTAPARFMRRSRAMRLGSVSGLSVILISSRASIRFGILLIILYAVIYCGLFNTPLLYINLAMWGMFIQNIVYNASFMSYISHKMQSHYIQRCHIAIFCR